MGKMKSYGTDMNDWSRPKNKKREQAMLRRFQDREDQALIKKPIEHDVKQTPDPLGVSEKASQ